MKRGLKSGFLTKDDMSCVFSCGKHGTHVLKFLTGNGYLRFDDKHKRWVLTRKGATLLGYKMLKGEK